MLTISTNKIFDENNKLIAVQIPIDDYQKLEEVIEDYGLGKLIEESDLEETLTVNEAKVYYNQIPDPE